jgi:imidazolonepropionase-like amidohydrolase
VPRTLYRDVALADGSGPELRLGLSVLVTDEVIDWVRPVDAEEELPAEARVVDASGCTLVPGLVDSHSHLSLPGGAHWIERGYDDADELLQVAEHNARLQRSALGPRRRRPDQDRPA